MRRMRSTRTRYSPWIVLFCALAAGLASGAPPSETPFVVHRPSTADAELAGFAAVLPGFGGLYYDEEGHPNIYLRDPRVADELRLGGEVRVHQGRYDFPQLLRWKGDLRQLLALSGVVFVDADERQNRIVLGVEPGAEETVEKLRLQLAKRGIPAAAVRFQETAPMRSFMTIQDQFNKVPGGVRIGFGNSECTLGFNANRGVDKGFVTNSHCSATRGALDGTVYFQNTTASQRRIGVEVVDPGFFTGGACPAGFSCRYSDALFARYDNPSADRKFARLARTRSSGRIFGSIVINPTIPRFVVSGKRNFPSAGQVLHKMGQASGWTKGSVTNTCADVPVPGTSMLYLCQFFMDSAAVAGDSGAPIFIRSGQNARLAGLLWGGNIDLSVASPMSNIETELGVLQVR